ncbi:hypothetical protein [Streptomyces sp. GESEQ-35]|uniref:hypothetical protein n=1 Tax=Streptomyces sp. GESEQ-35 TaxID=2812657 RepID=UPI0027E2AB79|nr:hypothetical protein [Streptomyces sp. GESEQ-35]
MRVNAFMLLAAFAADWSRLSRLIGPDARRTLSERLAELRTADADHASAADRAARTVLDALPPEEAARLRQDGVGTGRYADPPAADLHGGFGAGDLCMLVLDGNPMVGPVLGPIRERLLREPSSPWTEGTDPRLIALSDEDGRRRVPLFQFEAGTMPWQVVLEVNDILRADTDPWGAADWWLSRTTWWPDPPAELLGRRRDTELLGGARELAAMDGEG